MTTTTLFQKNTNEGMTKASRKSHLYNHNSYQVEVTGEDGEYLNFEIMADSFSEASAQAEWMAQEEMSDIQWINVTYLG